MGTWKYLLASFVALAGCDMSKTPTEDTINPITQERIQACKRLVVWVIAREDQQIIQSGSLDIEYRGTTEAVQIQRDPKKPQELYSIKVVRSADWKIHNFSMWNGVWGEESKWIDWTVDANAEIALWSVEESWRSEDQPSRTVPTCTYKKGIYSVDETSNTLEHRYTVINHGFR